MQYTICGYQQSEAIKLVDTVTTVRSDGTEVSKTIRIDTTDLMILRWFAEFYPNMEKTIIDGKEYGWIDHGHILEELPILDINVRSVNARMKKLVHFGLLEYQKTNHKNGTKGNWSFYRFGERYASLVRSDGQTTYLGRSNDLGSVVQPTYPLCSQTTYKDSSTSDSSTRSCERGRFAPPTRDEVEAYAREKGYNGFPADRFVAYYESNGWIVGRTKMKSWKAAVSNWWLREDKGKQQAQQPKIQVSEEIMAEWERENEAMRKRLGII